jgi:hypothetical protein
MRRRSEAEGVVRVEECAEQFGRRAAELAARRQNQIPPTRDDRLGAIAECRNVDCDRERVGRFVDRVDSEPVRALVGNDQLDRAESPPQAMPDRLRQAG